MEEESEAGGLGVPIGDNDLGEGARAEKGLAEGFFGGHAGVGEPFVFGEALNERKDLGYVSNDGGAQ